MTYAHTRSSRYSHSPSTFNRPAAIRAAFRAGEPEACLPRFFSFAGAQLLSGRAPRDSPANSPQQSRRTRVTPRHRHSPARQCNDSLATSWIGESALPMERDGLLVRSPNEIPSPRSSGPRSPHGVFGTENSHLSDPTAERRQLRATQGLRRDSCASGVPLQCWHPWNSTNTGNFEYGTRTGRYEAQRLRAADTLNGLRSSEVSHNGGTLNLHTAIIRLQVWTDNDVTVRNCDQFARNNNAVDCNRCRRRRPDRGFDLAAIRIPRASLGRPVSFYMRRIHHAI